MSDFYDKWRKQAESYKPKKETDQNVLWLKQMAIMSPHFKHLDEGNKIITEAMLNACMQLCYDQATELIEERSFNAGRESYREELAEQLGLTHD